MLGIDTDQGRIGFERRRSDSTRAIKIRVDAKRKVTVFAAPKVSKSEVESTVKKKAKWIFKKLQLIEENKIRIPRYEFISGESFLLKGKLYRLKVIKSKKEGIRNDTSRIFCMTSNRKSALVKKILVEWYKRTALEHISGRVARLQGKFRKKPGRIFVRDQAARWGSCSKSDQLRFNWRIIMAPSSVIDYVIVHELAHVQEKNHTERFWELLEAAMPNYEQKKIWLRVYGGGLRID